MSLPFLEYPPTSLPGRFSYLLERESRIEFKMMSAGTRLPLCKPNSASSAKTQHLSEPQFPHLQNGVDRNIHLIGTPLYHDRGPGRAAGGRFLSFPGASQGGLKSHHFNRGCPGRSTSPTQLGFPEVLCPPSDETSSLSWLSHPAKVI